MKTRLGHITNSSSSSYIVALNKKVGNAVSTIKDLCAQWDKTIEQYKDDYPSVDFDEAEKALEKGKFLTHISIDGLGGNHEEDIEYLLGLGDIEAVVVYAFED